MKKHTPKKWETSCSTQDRSFDICAAGGGDMIADLKGCGDALVQQANAERIVACVNACDGITNEQLLSSGVPNWKLVIVDIYGDGENIEVFADEPGIGLAIKAFRAHDRAYNEAYSKRAAAIVKGDNPGDDFNYTPFQPFMQARGFRPLPVRRWFRL